MQFCSFWKRQIHQRYVLVTEEMREVHGLWSKAFGLHDVF